MSNKKTGRPTLYTQELGDEICERIADGQSLRTIGKQEHMPNYTIISSWVAKGSRGDERYKGFYEQYARAKEDQAESGYEDIIAIEKQLLAGEISPHVARVWFDSVKWRLGKLKAKKYGDKLDLDIKGDLIVERVDYAVRKAEGKEK